MKRPSRIPQSGSRAAASLGIVAATAAALITVAGCGANNGEKVDSPTATPLASSNASSPASTPATPVPNGRIVYRHSDDSGDSEQAGSLFVSNTDGSAERQLTDGADKGFFDLEPNWSPDGKQVVFSRYNDTGHRISVVSASGTGLHDLSPGAPTRGDTIVGFDEKAAFSPDGTHIAYEHSEGVVKNDQIPHSDVMVMNSDGSHKRHVTHLPAFAGDVDGVRWSPDGKQLVYSLFTANTGTPAHSGALFVVDVGGKGTPRQLTPWALGAGGIPAWSKTGLIAFRAVQDEESGVGNFYTIRPTGDGLTQVTHFNGQTISHQVGMSPDGEWIVFSKKNGTGGPNTLMIISLNGPNLYPVGPADRTGTSPDWDPAP